MSISFTNRYLLIKGEPAFIFGGDFCYARSSLSSWKDRMLKMKAAGLNTVCSYIPWQFHEYEEGKWRWHDNADLARFIDITAELDMFAIIRLGPFIHAEWKNGGLPEWLVEKLGHKVRTNHPDYFKYADRWYKKLIEIIKPRQVTKGGPIIIVQVENELGNAGCKGDDISCGSSEENINHGHVLHYHQLLREGGIEVPYLDINTIHGKEEMGNVLAGGGIYLDSCFYGERSFPEPDYDRWQKTKKPLITIETQGGMFARYFDYPNYLNTRRFQGPIVDPEILEAIVLLHLGEGFNGVNFYIFVDGKNPDGAAENMLPEKDYNFQAPITSCGTLRKSYQNIKRLGWFLRSFKQEILNSQPAPQWAKAISYGNYNPVSPGTSEFFEPYETEKAQQEKDLQIKPVKCISRIKSGLNLSDSNFVFLINYHKTHKQWLHDIQISTTDSPKLAAEVPRVIPQNVQLTLPPNESRIIPFYIRIEPGKFLEYSTAQLLDKRRFQNRQQVILFCNREETAEMRFVLPGQEKVEKHGEALVEWESPNTLSVLTRPIKGMNIIEVKGKSALRIVLLDRNFAGEVWDVDTPEGEIAAISNMTILESKTLGSSSKIILQVSKKHNYLHLLSPKEPHVQTTDDLQIKTTEYDTVFNIYFNYLEINLKLPEIKFERMQDKKGITYIAELSPKLFVDDQDIILKIDYKGRRGCAYIDGKLFADHAFGQFRPWQLNLKEYVKKPVQLKIFLEDATDASIRCIPLRNLECRINWEL